jgi:hypothetical protein
MSKGAIKVVCEVKDYLPLDKILPHPDNPRSITDFRLQQLKEALTGTGLFKAFIVDEAGYCLAGNMRHQALVELQQEGWEIPADLPVVYYKGTEAKLVMLLDNNNFGFFDYDKVQGVLADIEAELGEGKDLSITGFTPNEIQMYTAEDEEADGTGIQKFQEYEEKDKKQIALEDRDYSLWVVFKDRQHAEEVCDIFGLKMRSNAFAQSFKYGDIFHKIAQKHAEEIKKFLAERPERTKSQLYQLTVKYLKDLEQLDADKDANIGALVHQLANEHKAEIEGLVAHRKQELEDAAREGIETGGAPPVPKKKQACTTKKALAEVNPVMAEGEVVATPPVMSTAPPILADEPMGLPIV